MHQSLSWKETFKLWWIALKVFWKRVLEAVNIVLFYYLPKPSFMREDLSLLAAYWKKSPYRISSEFWEAQGVPDSEIYGETPLTTMDLVATAADISDSDCVYELGCGRGRACFWLRKFRGCRVVGIEYIPEFMAKARKIQEQYRIEGIEFLQEDFFRSNFDGATVIYLYGTTMEEASIRQLVERFLELPEGTRFITVSYPLQDFFQGPLFKIERKVTVPFLWGEADVYIQHLI